MSKTKSAIIKIPWDDIFDFSYYKVNKPTMKIYRVILKERIK